jgi:hypothetical protein
VASVLNRTTKEFRPRANTPDFPSAQWIINPDLSAVAGFPAKYWKITGDVVSLMTPAERDAQDDADLVAEAAVTEGESELFGDGNDGDITETVSRTLTQDLYPKLYTVNEGVVIDNGGFRIVAKKGAFVHGIVRNNGAAAVGATGGAGAAAGTIGGGTAGATGTNAAGASSTALNTDATPGQGGRGGAGGAGSSGAGGTAGQIRNDNNSRVRPRRLETILAMADVDNILGATGVVRFQGGTGGGAGAGGGGGNLGGGGGGGGGDVVVAAPIIFIGANGALEARGGAGGNATNGNAGGGGGGGGGLIGTAAIQFRQRGQRNVVGGAPGNGSGSGVAGSAGNDGRAVHMRINT